MKKKITLALALIVLVCVAVMASAVFYRSRAALETSILRAASQQTAVASLGLETRLNESKSDVLFLAGTAPMRGILRAKNNRGVDPLTGSTYREWVQRFEKNAVSLLRNKPYYMQVRYLDETGRERVRVDARGTKIRISPARELQDKRAYPYFAETIGLPPGSTWVSPMNLNRERGRIEVPHRPTVRVVTPLQNSGLQREGVLIINIDARELMKKLDTEEGSFYVVDPQGYFLKHPQTAKTFGFDLGLNHRLSDRHPMLAAAMAVEDEAVMTDSADDETSSVESHILGFRKLYYNTPLGREYWAVVYELPAAVAFAPIYSLGQQFAVWALLTVSFGGVIGFVWADRFATPIVHLTDAAYRISHGSWDERVDETRPKDEIRRLAVAFNHMVDSLVVAEHQVRKLNAELERRVLERTAELQAANKELEAFSYSVSHDLRSPLRSIDGFSLALLEDCGDRLDAQGQDYLRRVRAASQRMAELIDDLLKLSRVTRAEMHRERINLSGLARSIMEALVATQPDRMVEVVIQPGMTAQADTRLLRVALENLLGNAWKFTGRKPHARIEFGARPGADGVTEYYVRDNGAGYDMAYAGKLFGAFQRLHSPHEFPGTGIGLATVQRIVHRHGGRVWAEAKTDEGATFYFTLPNQTTATGEEEHHAKQSDTAGRG